MTTAAATQPIVFRVEPALKTVSTDDHLPYEVADQDVSYQCAMRHNGHATNGLLGWIEREPADTYGHDLLDLQWVPFYEVQLPGDAKPTQFCEHCGGWLTQLAPHLLAASVAEIARHKLVTELPESYSADDVSAMSDDTAIDTAVSYGLLEG